MKNCVIVVFLLFVTGEVISQTATVQEVDDDNSSTIEYFPKYLNSTSKFSEVDLLPQANDTVGSTRLRFSGAQWITQLFRSAEDVFRVDTAASEPCQKAYQQFRMYLRNQTVWAVRMKESSEWPVVALLSGKMYHVGDWDECLTAAAPSFKGQYCLIQTLINIPLSGQYDRRPFEYPSENSSAWDVIREFASNPFRVDRRIINWALCMPSTCTITDIKISLDNTARPVFLKAGIDITFYEDSFSCSVREPHSHSIGYYVACFIFGCIILLVLTSTIYDTLDNKFVGESSCWFPAKLYKCFSARQNFLNLIRFSSLLTTNPGISVIKVIYIIGIIRGHRLFHEIVYPTYPTENTEIIYQTRDLTAISLTAVDIFFMLSGFLVFHMGYKFMKKFGAAYLFLCVIIKWIRMVPVVILLHLFVIYIFPYLADGPLWNIRVLPIAEMCRATWWTDLLAINNVVNSTPQCLPILWFVAVDIQLTILGNVLLYVVTKSTRIGAALTVTTFLLFAEIVGILVYRRNYRGALLVFLKNFENDKDADQFYKLYISPITRVGPYLIGFGTAFLIKFLKNLKYSLPEKMKTAIIVLTFVASRLYIFYEVRLTDVTRPYNPMEHAVYSAFKRSFYVLPVACILCMYFTFGLGKFNVLFEWKPSLVFGRLAYSVYLVHFIFQMFHASSRREYTFDYGVINDVWSVSADTVTSFFLAFIVYLISEGPINSMARLLQSYFIRPQMKLVSKNRPQSNGCNNNESFVNDEVPVPVEITTC